MQSIRFAAVTKVMQSKAFLPSKQYAERWEQEQKALCDRAGDITETERQEYNNRQNQWQKLRLQDWQCMQDRFTSQAEQLKAQTGAPVMVLPLTLLDDHKGASRVFIDGPDVARFYENVFKKLSGKTDNVTIDDAQDLPKVFSQAFSQAVQTFENEADTNLLDLDA